MGVSGVDMLKLCLCGGVVVWGSRGVQGCGGLGVPATKMSVPEEAGWEAGIVTFNMGCSGGYE